MLIDRMACFVHLSSSNEVSNHISRSQSKCESGVASRLNFVFLIREFFGNRFIVAYLETSMCSLGEKKEKV